MTMESMFEVSEEVVGEEEVDPEDPGVEVDIPLGEEAEGKTKSQKQERALEQSDQPS